MFCFRSFVYYWLWKISCLIFFFIDRICLSMNKDQLYLQLRVVLRYIFSFGLILGFFFGFQRLLVQVILFFLILCFLVFVCLIIGLYQFIMILFCLLFLIFLNQDWFLKFLFFLWLLIYFLCLLILKVNLDLYLIYVMLISIFLKLNLKWKIGGFFFNMQCGVDLCISLI